MPWAPGREQPLPARRLDYPHMQAGAMTPRRAGAVWPAADDHSRDGGGLGRFDGDLRPSA